MERVAVVALGLVRSETQAAMALRDPPEKARSSLEPSPMMDGSLLPVKMVRLAILVRVVAGVVLVRMEVEVAAVEDAVEVVAWPEAVAARVSRCSHARRAFPSRL
jgi:hypothetical protein